MTCVVAYKEDDCVYMGFDSIGMDNDCNYMIRKDPKVFINDEILYGFVGSFRMGQILMYSFKRPDHASYLNNFKEYIYGPFIDELIKCFKNKEIIKDDNGEISCGNFMFAFKGILYEVQDDFQIAEHDLHYNSLGIASHYALGALKILEGKKINVVKRLTTALETSAFFSAAVRKPYIILGVDKRGDKVLEKEIE